MRTFFALLSICATLITSAQEDTIVIKDFTKALITIGEDGNIQLVTDLSEVNEAGFFLNKNLKGKIRICNPKELYGWGDGKLIFRSINCKILAIDDFFRFSKSDTVFVALSTKRSLKNLTCELILLEELKVIDEELIRTREVRMIFKEFIMIAILGLLFLCAVMVAYSPQRISFIFKRTFSLNKRIYEFISTSFFRRVNILITLTLCLLIAFEITYFDYKAGSNFPWNSSAYLEYLYTWIQIFLLVLGGLLAKWFIILVVSKLFSFREIIRTQLFDMINFFGLFAFILFGVVLVDFMFFESMTNLFQGVSIFFPILLILFELWFSFKFVIISLHRKLLLISYLCATEIIPAIFILSRLLE